MENLEKTDEKTYKVPNLEKGIQVIELLATSNRAMTLNEVKNETDISQTTAYRILHTLVRQGYVLYDDSSKKYRLTKRMLTIGLQAIQEQNILEIVLPKMRELRNIVKETVCFGVMGEDKGLFIEQILGAHPFSFILSPGKLFELHCSAPGKAIMAFVPDDVRNLYLSKMNYEIYNSNTIKSEPEYLKELEKVRQNGYAVDMEEELHGVVCIGAPIFNYSNAACGAIWISGPKDRLGSKIISNIADSIMMITRSVSFELGYNIGNKSLK